MIYAAKVPASARFGLLLFVCGVTILAGCSAAGISGSHTGSLTTSASARQQPYIIGADVTWVLEDEAAGATYFENGVKKDLLDILVEHGFNALRIRTFFDPHSARGYSARRPEAFGDLDHLLTLARRAKAHHMDLLVDIMYSDNWADPEGQNKPVAWQKLKPDELVQAVREYTHKVIAALQAQDTTPTWVQIGNEITHGMLWPDARVTSQISSGNAQTDAKMRASGLTGLGHYDELATILKAAIDEVHAVDPSIKIVLHNHLGRSWERLEEWCDNLISRGVKFDIIGMSCYAQGVEGDWKTTFDNIAKKYPDHDFLVLEYSARKEYINGLVFNTPGGHGLGAFIWEPTRHREALFNKKGVNAGGGQASNFVNDLSTNQGAAAGTDRSANNPTSRPTAPVSTTRSTTGPTSRPTRGRGQGNRNGGRYDTNDFLKLYDKIASEYGARSTTQPSQ